MTTDTERTWDHCTRCKRLRSTLNARGVCAGCRVPVEGHPTLGETLALSQGLVLPHVPDPVEEAPVVPSPSPEAHDAHNADDVPASNSQEDAGGGHEDADVSITFDVPFEDVQPPTDTRRRRWWLLGLRR